jgi:hypothetical protein
MQLGLKFIKGGVLNGALGVLGILTLPSLLTSTDNTALTIGADNVIGKRLLGDLAFKSATDFYTRTDADNTFLKKTGGTMTGDLLVDNHRIRFGEAGSNTITRDDAGEFGPGVSSGFYQALGKVNYPTTSAGWWHLLDVRHSNPTNNFAMQMAGAFDDQRFFLRKTANLATQAWSEILTMDTDGVLNAEKLVIKTAYRPDKNRAGLTFIGVSGITGASNWALRGVYQYSAGVNSNSVGGDLDLIKALNGNTILGTKTDGTALGFVGVGTESPLSRFHVAAATSTVLFTGLGTTNGSIQFDGSGSKGAAIKFNTEGAYIGNVGGSNELINYSSPQSHVFLSGGSEVGRFSQSGFSTGGWSITGADLVVRILSRGTGGRAIVHDSNNRLALNYANDFAETSIGSNILFRNGASSYILNSNFGIGTATPNSRFVVNGGTLSTDYVSSEARIGDGAIHLQKTVTGGIFEAVRAMNMDATAGTTVRLVAAVCSQPFVNESQGKGFLDFIRFSQNGDVDFSISLANAITGPVERLRVKGSNGYVGIGIANPTQALDVAGNVNANNYYQNGVLLNNFSGKYADLTGTPDMGAVWGAINGKANTSHRHNFSDIDGFFLGNKPQIETGRAYYGSGNLYSYNVYGGQTTNSPSGLTFGNVLTWGGNGSATQLVTGWTVGDQNFIAFRSLRDNTDDWWAFKRIYHEGYKPLVADIGGLNDSLNAIWQDIHNKANSNHTHDYNSLTNRPDLSAYLTWGNVVSDNANVNTTNGNPIATKLVSIYVNDLWGAVNSKANANHTHNWESITGKPTFFDGNYNSLTNRPDLSAYLTWGNVVSDNANVNATNGNPIATKLVSIYVNDLWGAVNSKANVNHTHDWSTITGKPAFFDGNYNNLSNRPNLSGYLTWANVVSDNANVNTTNGSPIATKLVSGYVNDLWAAVNSKANVNHTHDWSTITGKPTFFDGNYNNLSNRPDLSGFLDVYNDSVTGYTGRKAYGNLYIQGDLKTLGFTASTISVTNGIQAKEVNISNNLTVNGSLFMPNPAIINSSSDINPTSIEGVYVKAGNYMVKLTLNQFINLLEQL